MQDITISTSALTALVTQALNPQPLPPKEAFGPLPDPWTWTKIAQQFVAGMLVAGGDESRNDELTSWIQKFVDDKCGTPPKVPIPVGDPSGPLVSPDTLHPTNLLAMAVQFQSVADALEGHQLRAAFADGAGRLFEAAAVRRT